jgi:SOS response regulatory protein OraA/RecX
VPRITGLTEQRGGRVAVEVEGAPWRTIPLDAAVAAELRVGVELDRPRLRAVRRELRRTEALAWLVRALRRRDLSRRALEQRLDRAGFTADEQRATLATLERAGLVDDARVAATKARSLAERGYGDAAIRFALEGEQLAAELVEAALAALEPERERVKTLLRDPADVKALRRLAARGFASETLEDVAGFANGS